MIFRFFNYFPVYKLFKLFVVDSISAKKSVEKDCPHFVIISSFLLDVLIRFHNRVTEYSPLIRFVAQKWLQINDITLDFFSKWLFELNMSILFATERMLHIILFHYSKYLFHHVIVIMAFLSSHHTFDCFLFFLFLLFYEIKILNLPIKK